MGDSIEVNLNTSNNFTSDTIDKFQDAVANISLNTSEVKDLGDDIVANSNIMTQILNQIQSRDIYDINQLVEQLKTNENNQFTLNENIKTSFANIELYMNEMKINNNNLFANIVKLTNNDISATDLFSKIIDNQESLRTNNNEILNKIIDYDNSMNTLITNNSLNLSNQLTQQQTDLTTLIINELPKQFVDVLSAQSVLEDKIVDVQLAQNQLNVEHVKITSDILLYTYNTDLSINQILDKLYDSNINSGGDLTTLLNSMNTNYNSLFQSIHNNDVSMNNLIIKLDENFNNIVSNLNQTDLSINNTMDTINVRYVDIVNKIIDNDVSNNNSHNNLFNKLIENDMSFNTLSTSIVNVVDKMVDNDNSMNVITENIVNVVEKLTDNDISLNSIINKTLDNQRAINDTNDKLTQIDASFTSLIPTFNSALNSLTNSSNNTAASVTTASTALETLLKTIDENTNSTQQENQKTQQLLVEYIGKHIVIPLFEQRVNDITAQNYGDLENIVLVHLNTALYKYRIGDFEGLKLVFNKTIKDEYTMNIHNLKKTAFVRYMSTTPGAHAISDLNVHARSHYKTFKKYITNIYRSLDGLEKSIVLYDEFKNLEGINELNKIKADILDDPDKLKEYIRDLNKKNQAPALFDVSGSSTAAPTVKPQYIEYIKRYGVPDKGIFDSQKMADIIVELTSSGVMNPLPQYPVEPPYSTSEPNTTSSSSDGHTSEVTATTSDTATATDTATGTDTDTGYDSQGLPLTATGTDTATASDTDTGNDWPDSDDFSEFSESDSDDSDGDARQTYDDYLANWIKDYSGNNVDASGNTTGDPNIHFHVHEHDPNDTHTHTHD